MKKKLIGLALWLIALLIPFKYAILDTDEVVLENGRADNITGLLAFVATVVLLFVGYFIFDSAGSKPAQDDGHGH
ncbi:MAG: hypothetical protein ABI432_17145 [Flavobacteriales bacterium]